MKVFVLGLIPMFLVFAPPLQAAEPVVLQDFSGFHEGEDFVAELLFDRPLQQKSINVDFINETIQINIPGVQYPAKKKLSRLNKRNVRSLYAYQHKKNLLRLRIIYKKGWPATRLSESVLVSTDGARMRITVREADPMAKAKTGELSRIVSIDDDSLPPSIQLPKEFSENFLKNMALVVEPKDTDSDMKNKKESEIPIGKKTKNNESEIPVLTASTGDKGKNSSPYFRMVASLIVVLALFAGFALFMRKWKAKASGGNSTNQIKVLTQHHIGPKKSLAIVRVAGESILVGITDQNISLIKSLSFVDDEIPETVPNNFAETLQKQDAEPPSPPPEKPAEEEEAFTMTGLNEIKNIVTKRLGKMRPIS